MANRRKKRKPYPKLPKAPEVITHLEIIDNVLSQEERDKLTRLEQLMMVSAATFERVRAETLLTIRNERLYREDYHDFESYCMGRWALSKPYCTRLIHWAETREALSGLPEFEINPIDKESHARYLYEGLDEPEDRVIAFKTAVATLKQGQSLTAHHIQRVVRVIKEAKATGGFVDIGDGTMTALQAAVELDVQEEIKRYNQSIADRSLYEWIAGDNLSAAAVRSLSAKLDEQLAHRDEDEIVKIVIYGRKSFFDASRKGEI